MASPRWYSSLYWRIAIGFVVFLAATVLHAIVFMGLYVLLDLRQFGALYAAVGGQALGNAIVGVIAFRLIEFLPGALERPDAQRSRIRG